MQQYSCRTLGGGSVRVPVYLTPLYFISPSTDYNSMSLPVNNGDEREGEEENVLGISLDSTTVK